MINVFALGTKDDFIVTRWVSQHLTLIPPFTCTQFLRAFSGPLPVQFKNFFELSFHAKLLWLGLLVSGLQRV